MAAGESDKRKKLKKCRADLLLVERGLCEDVEKAKRLIMAREVFVETVAVEKPGDLWAEDCAIWVKVKERGRYVGRGGLKMEGAIESFGIEVAGMVCLDIGASTGGFTDCLLQHGAVRVHAIDAGTNQLVWKLRSDERVISREQFNARDLQVEDLGEQVDLVVIDVSFISLKKILPAAFRVLKEGGRVMALVKPQFELARHEIGEGGIVREEAMQEKALTMIKEFTIEDLGREWLGDEDSPIKGTEGNREFVTLMS